MEISYRFSIPDAILAPPLRLAKGGWAVYLEVMKGKKVVCVFGWSNTGKTLFIERAVKLLSDKGFPCGTLKCTRHPGTFQLPGKDSTRFFRAGAESAFIGGPETLLSLRTPETLDRAFLDRLFPNAEYVLVEGGEIDGALRVLMAGSAGEEGELKLPFAKVDLVVTDNPALTGSAECFGVRALRAEDTQAFLEILEDQHGA